MSSDFSEKELARLRQMGPDLDPADYILVPREALIVGGAIGEAPQFGLKGPHLLLTCIIPLDIKDVELPRVMTRENMANPMEGMVPLVDLRLMVPRRRLRKGAVEALERAEGRGAAEGPGAEDPGAGSIPFLRPRMPEGEQ